MIILSGSYTSSLTDPATSYLANNGSNTSTTASDVEPQSPVAFPVGTARTFKGMMIVSPPGQAGNITGVAITVTLVRYPAGNPLGGAVLTSIAVVIPIGAGSGSFFSDLAHTADYSPGDAFDVRVDVPTAPTPTTCPITVTLF
jgi:hypothetical protein